MRRLERLPGVAWRKLIWHRRPTFPAAAIFVAALFVVGGFLVLAPDSLRPNEAYNDYEVFYRPVAENLLEGNGYVGDDGLPELHNPPGYPLILAVVYLVARVVGISQASALTGFTVLTMAACAVVIFFISRELLTQGQAVMAALLYITYPITLVVASYRFSEVPFSLVLYIAVLIFIRASRRYEKRALWMVIVGGCIGYASLIRPAALALAVPFVVALWFSPNRGTRRRLPLAAAILAGNLAIVLPWEAWVLTKTDRLVVLSTADKDSVLDGLTVTFRPHDESGTLAMPDDLRRLMAEVAERRQSFGSISEIGRFLVRYGSDHPGTMVMLAAFKAVRGWYGTNALKWEGLILAVQVPYLTLMGAGVVMALRQEQRRAIAVLIAGCVLYFWAVTLVVLPIVRLIAPALGLLFPFAALTLATVWQKAQARWGRSKPALTPAH